MKEAWFIAQIGRRRYGLPVQQVVEVVRACRLIPIPQSPPALLGALLFRGQAVPIVDIRPRLGADAPPLSPAHFFLVGQVGHQRGGILADRVHGLIELEPQEGAMPDVPAPEYVVGTALDASKESVLLLDLSRILSASEARAIATAMETGVPREG